MRLDTPVPTPWWRSRKQRLCPAGSVTAIDGAGLPAVHTPNEADIYKAIGELEKKIQQLGRNQKTIETKLEHVAARVDAANANLIMGVQFLDQGDEFHRLVGERRREDLGADLAGQSALALNASAPWTTPGRTATNPSCC